MTKLAIDARPLFSGQKTGVPRVLWNLLDRLFQEDRGMEFLLYVSDLEKDVALPEAWRNIRLVRLSSRLFSQKRLWENFALPRGLGHDGADLFLATHYVLPYRLPCPALQMIYDISYEVHFEWFPPLKGRYVRAMSRFGARKAEQIVTISEFSEREIIRHYGILPERVSRFYPAPDPSFYDPLDMNRVHNVKNLYDIEGEYILYVGSLHRRRQIHEMLAAMAPVPGEPDLDRTLVMVGHNNFSPRLDIEDLIREQGAEGRVRYLDFVPEKHLLPLYHGADAVVYISQYEGFGLPVIEAMACAKPVVVSNIEVMQEVAGDAAVQVNPYSVDEIRTAFRNLSQDRQYREQMARKGYERSLLFTWEKAAEDFQGILEMVLQRIRG